MLAPGLPTGADTVPDASTLPPGQSAFSFEPRPMTASPPPAQAPAAAAPPGFKPTPNYIRDAIARNVNDPTLRAYLGSLSGSEAKNAQDVSPTGAAGPFQFIPSTAKQYGLTDPTNLDASVIAAKKLTQDNAAAFERINGRPPTAPELALMHQQGGVTGARMVAGTGNAPSGNLAVNNVNPNASPQQAVARIRGYYGMPNVPVNVRDTIAQTMAQGRPPVPQGMAGAAPIVPAGMSPQGAPPPVMAQGGDQALAFNGQPQQPPLPPAITSGIQKAPPPVQVAQNGPPPPGYVPPAAGPVQGAPVIPMSPEHLKIASAIAQAQARGDQYLPALLAPRLQALEAERTQRQNEANEVFKSRLLQAAKQNELHLTGQMDAPKRIADIQKTQAEIDAARLQETEGKLVRNDDGSYSPPRITGVDPNAAPFPKMTAEQAKDQKFHMWTSLAEEQLNGNDKILAEGLKDQLAGKVPFAGNKVMSAKYRRTYAAAERFIQGFLRDISGAAIAPEEMAKHQATFLPRYGDDAATIADKKAARDNVINGFYSASGPGHVISDYYTKQRQDTQAATDERLNAEMKDAPKVVGKVLVNPAKPNLSRVWNGKRWEEY